MNRNTTVLTVCGLLMLADIISAKQTFSMRSELDPVLLNSLVAAETMLAFGFVSVFLLLTARSSAGRKSPSAKSVSKLFGRYAVYSYPFGPRGDTGDDRDCRPRNPQGLSEKLYDLRVRRSIHRR